MTKRKIKINDFIFKIIKKENNNMSKVKSSIFNESVNISIKQIKN